MKKTIFVVLAAATVAVSSCKKDEDNSSNTPSNTNTASKKELLTAKPWKTTGLTIGGADLWSQFDACEKDNIYTFKTNGVYIDDEGATKCDPADPQIVTTSTWALIENDTKLVYDGDTAIINEISSSKMVLQSDFLGAPAIATFAAQ